MMEIVESTEEGVVMRLTAAQLYLLHGALRDGMNDIPDPTALAEEPARVGALLLALGEVLWWMSDPPEKRRRRSREDDWYWSQWVQPRPYPERLRAVSFDVALSNAELEILRRVTPLAVAAVGAADWDARVGCSVERSGEIHRELLDAIERAGR